ncbi:MAG: SDR family NAD(P)-dependent oxidoreductase [Hespellia sp.]|nr:SDR family NAD(P)-dependent oxidoreductase [Hespellia sp.]
MKILITGSGQGLGSSIAAIALSRGHEIIAAVHSRRHVSAKLEKMEEKNRGRVKILEMDVAQEESVSQIAEMFAKADWKLDAIVNNAAIMEAREKTIEELDLGAVSRAFEVNTIGPMRVIQKFLPYLKKGNNQVIVNISSEAGTIINAFPTNYPYSMSKSALNMFSERLREALKEHGILVYAVHPGWMRTNMGGVDAPALPEDIANGILDILERKKKIYSKIAFIDSTGRPMPL